MFKSTDSGTTWNAINSGLTSLNVQALTIDPTTPSTLYAGTQNGGVFKSTDSGTTWNAANSRLTSLNVQVLTIDLVTSTTLYAGTQNGGVFKSTDGGARWESAPNPFYGGGYKTTSLIGSNVLVGCYSEGGQGYGHEFVPPTLVLGGQLGDGFNPIANAGIISRIAGIDQIVGLRFIGTIANPIRTFHWSPLDQAPEIKPNDRFLLVDASGGNVSPSLELGSSDVLSGQQFTVKRIDASNNVVDIRQAGGGLIIDGQFNYLLVGQDSEVTFVADKEGDDPRQWSWKIVGEVRRGTSGRTTLPNA